MAPIAFRGTADEFKIQYEHLLRPEHIGLGDIRALYDALRVIPTSTVATTILIRSWLAYWGSASSAESAVIKPSRGHSYSIKYRDGSRRIVRVRDYYDHRDGVIVTMANQEYPVLP